MLSLLASLLLWSFVVYRLPTLRGSAVQRTMTMAAIALAGLQTVHSDAVWEAMVGAWGVEGTSVVKQAVMLALMASVVLFIRAVEGRTAHTRSIVMVYIMAGVIMAAPMPWARHGPVVVTYEDQAVFYGSSWAWVIHWLVVSCASAWSTAVAVRFCLSYSRRAPQLPVRAGMFLIGAGAAIGLTLVLIKAAVIISGIFGFAKVWSGSGGQVESSLIVAGCSTTLAGLCLTASSRGRLSLTQGRAQREALHHLEVLWTQLRGAVPYIVLPTRHPSILGHRGSSQRERLYRMVVEIRDGLLILSSYVEPSVFTATYTATVTAHLAPEARTATAHAVAVKVAISRHERGLRTSARPANSLVVNEADFGREVAQLVATSSLMHGDPLTDMFFHRMMHLEVPDEVTS